MLLAVNAGAEGTTFALPVMPSPGAWVALVDTAADRPRVVEETMIDVAPYSLVLLRHSSDRRITTGADALGNAGAVNTTVVGAAGVVAGVGT